MDRAIVVGARWAGALTAMLLTLVSGRLGRE
jgi:hypothetical protein